MEGWHHRPLWYAAAYGTEIFSHLSTWFSYSHPLKFEVVRTIEDTKRDARYVLFCNQFVR